MANIIRITVGGIPYSISCEDDEAYVKSLANELESRMNTLAKNKPFLSTTMVAVMSALEAFDTAKKTAAENEQLRLEIKRLMEEAACARLDAVLEGRFKEKDSDVNDTKEEF